MAGAESTFIGRQWEMSALAGMLGQAINGYGRVVGVVGPPGIGKSRIVREAAALATRDDVAVFTTYCESHTTDIAFRAVAGLLCAALGTSGLDGVAARARGAWPACGCRRRGSGLVRRSVRHCRSGRCSAAD
jgi:adenylate cyclase